MLTSEDMVYKIMCAWNPVRLNYIHIRRKAVGQMEWLYLSGEVMEQ